MPLSAVEIFCFFILSGSSHERTQDGTGGRSVWESLPAGAEAPFARLGRDQAEEHLHRQRLRRAAPDVGRQAQFSAFLTHDASAPLPTARGSQVRGFIVYGERFN
jgi:hypothetical protein